MSNLASSRINPTFYSHFTTRRVVDNIHDIFRPTKHASKAVASQSQSKLQHQSISNYTNFFTQTNEEDEIRGGDSFTSLFSTPTPISSTYRTNQPKSSTQSLTPIIRAIKRLNKIFQHALDTQPTTQMITSARKMKQSRMYSTCSPGFSVKNETTTQSPPPKVTINKLMKKYKAGEKISMITAYDFSQALLVERSDIDILLVGDSLGMVMLGYQSTIPVDMNHMLHHCKAVKNGANRPFLVGDLPFGSYEVDSKDAYKNALLLLKEGGVDAIKMEGGSEIAPTIEILTRAGIPVMGHIGLQPQHSKSSSYRYYGRTKEEKEKLLQDAEALQRAGCFALILESVFDEVAEEITSSLQIPTIGIGAGRSTNGQVLVWHDLLGWFDRQPRFATKYDSIGDRITSILNRYHHDVVTSRFPFDPNCRSVHSISTPSSSSTSEKSDQSSLSSTNMTTISTSSSSLPLGMNKVTPSPPMPLRWNGVNITDRILSSTSTISQIIRSLSTISATNTSPNDHSVMMISDSEDYHSSNNILEMMQIMQVMKKEGAEDTFTFNSLSSTTNQDDNHHHQSVKSNDPKVLIIGSGSMALLYASMISKEYEKNHQHVTLCIYDPLYHPIVDSIQANQNSFVVFNTGITSGNSNSDSSTIEGDRTSVFTTSKESDVLEFFGSKADIAILLTKGYQLLERNVSTEKMVKEDGIVCGLQNGIGYENFVALHENQLFIRGTSSFAAKSLSSTEVIKTSENGKTTLVLPSTLPTSSSSQNIIQLLQLLNFGDGSLEITTDETLLYEKLIINAVINPITALLDIPNRHIADSNELSPLIRGIVEEAILTLRLINDPSELKHEVDQMVEKVKKIAFLTGENTSSMLSDVKRGSATEIDFINGYIVKEAQKKNVAVPMNSMLLSLIKSKTLKF